MRRWLLTPLALVLLAAAPSWATDARVDDDATASVAEPPERRYSVLVLDLQPTNAPPEEVRIITDLIAANLSEVSGFNVLSSADISQALGVEAQRQSLGCDDEGCLAELAGALGAELVVGGSVGKLGSLTVVNLSFFDSRAARSAGRKAIQVRDIEELPDAVRLAVLDIVAEIAPGAVERARAARASSPSASAVGGEGAGPSLLLLGGGAAAGAGALGLLGFGGLAFAFDQVLGDASAKTADKESARALGLGSLALAAVSAVVVVGGSAVLTLGLME